MFREDKQQWAHANIEIDDEMIERATDKQLFYAGT